MVTMRTVHYKQCYKIVIKDKFYEVSIGNKMLYFGQLRHRPTPQEVWNKTIGLEQEEERIARQRIRSNNTANCCRQHYSSITNNFYIIKMEVLTDGK